MGGGGGCIIDKGIEAGIEGRHTNQNRANVIGRMPQKASAACKELETYSARLRVEGIVTQIPQVSGFSRHTADSGQT